MKKGSRKPSGATPAEITLAARMRPEELARNAKSRVLGRTIRYVRGELGLTQTEFGKLMGVDQRRVSNWEQGRSLAAVRVGMKLAALLDRERTMR